MARFVMHTPAPDPLHAIRAAFAAGRRLDAFAALQPLWAEGMRTADPAFLQLAHDVCWWASLETRRFWVGRRMFRCHPRALWAWSRHLCDLARRDLLLRAWELAQRADRPAATTPLEAAEWDLACCRVSTQLRDFDAARAALQRAMATAACPARCERERAWLLRAEDDLAGALAVCRAARATWPDDTLLQEQEFWLATEGLEPAASLPIATAATARIQEPGLLQLRASLLFECGDAAGARDAMIDLLATAPLERGVRATCQLLLARAQRVLGDDDACLATLSAAGPRLRVWRERMANRSAAGAGRVQLAVPFVRQDHMTCSPATMASLLAWFGQPVDQREIARRITYDGTPSHAELTWAEGHGYAIWFFTFDLEVAHALIDRGLPFAISTRAEDMGHRMAVIGYDRALGSLLLRDPGTPFVREMDDDWIVRTVARGGDCALLLPVSEVHRVPIELLPAHAEMRDLQMLRQAYERRDIATADILALRLAAAVAPAVRWEAALVVAWERGDRRTQLSLLRERYEAHGDDAYWQYRYAVELHNQGRWGPFAELLERHSSRRSPYLGVLLADHLRHVATTRPVAERLARQATRWLPLRTKPLRLLADILWADLLRRPTAVEFYRLAACLEPLDEGLAESYALACAKLGDAERGLAYLRQRAATHGVQRPGPRVTYAHALDRQNRREEALLEMRAAVAVVDEPWVRSSLFDLLLSDGRRAEARTLLADAARWHPVTRLDAMRRLAEAEGDQAAARAAIAQHLALDPTSTDVTRRHLEYVLGDDGRAAAVAAAHAIEQAHGDDPRLMLEVEEFLDAIEARGDSERLLQRLAAEHPQEAWLQGRLARFLIAAGRAAETRDRVAQLLAAVPDSLPIWMDAIDCHEALGETAEARRLAGLAAARFAGSRSIVRRRRQLATSAAAAAGAVRDAIADLCARPLPPDADDLHSLVQAAAAELEDGETEAFLQRLQERFTDEPEVAAARLRWLVEHDAAAAVAVGEELVRRFPWVTDYWIQQARALRRAGRRSDERALLEQLLTRDRGAAQAYVELGESLEEEGRTAEALRTYDRGLLVAQHHPTLHGMRANLLWSLGDRDGAIAAADRAAGVSADYVWARRVQVLWRIDCGYDDAALAHAEACVRDNPREAFAHRLLADAHQKLGDHDAGVEALRAALRCDPRVGETRRRLIDVLVELSRFDDAEAVIAEGVELLGQDPELLLRRAAIQRARGDFAGSRAALQGLLQQHPDDTDLWMRLLRWWDEEGMHDEILELYRKPPDALAAQPVLHGYAGDALRKRKDLAGAEKALARALELEPAYDWARDELAEVLLERGRAAAVAALYGEAGDPALVQFARAALLARAAAKTGRRADAEALFRRLLREPEADAAVLRTVDNELRAHAKKAQRRLLVDELAASAASGDALVHEQILQLMAMRGERAFFAAARRFASWVPAEERELRLARLAYAANKGFGGGPAHRFVREHCKAPIRDVDAWGRLLFALGGRAGSALAIELTAGDFRRVGVQGWMLANLVGAHAELRQWAAVEAVANYALHELPRDHSVWWHRRYLAEAAYWRGDHARCRELCAMPVDDYPSVKVHALEFDLLAQLATTPSYFARRRLLHARVDEILRLAVESDLDDRGGGDTVKLCAGEFCRRVPSLLALLLFLRGRWRRWLWAFRA